MRNDVAEGAKVTQQLIDDGAVYLHRHRGRRHPRRGSVACAAGVPISTGLGTAPTLVGDMGPCAYQLVMSDNIQAAVLAEYALAQGYKTAYVLGSNDIPYTKNLPLYFSDAFEHGGGTVVGTDEYKIGAGDYSAVVTKLANVDPAPDAVYHADVHPRQRRVPAPAPAGRAHDAGPVHRRERRRCPPGCRRQGDRRVDLHELGVHREGDPSVQAFYADYNAANGKDPSSYVAVIGYDEINIVEVGDRGRQQRRPRPTSSPHSPTSTTPASQDTPSWIRRRDARTSRRRWSR